MHKVEGNGKTITEAEAIDKVSVETEEEKEECEVMIEVEAGVIKTGEEIVVVILAEEIVVVILVEEIVVVILVEVIEMISNEIMLMKMITTLKNNQIFKNLMNQQESIEEEVELTLEEKAGGIIIIRKIKL